MKRGLLFALIILVFAGTAAFLSNRVQKEIPQTAPVQKAAAQQTSQEEVIPSILTQEKTLAQEPASSQIAAAPAQTAPLPLVDKKKEQPVVEPAPEKQPTPPTPPEPETQKSKTVTIEHTDNGYQPGLVSISIGDTVIFKNTSTHRMWTASNPHPAHSIYLEFDARHGYNPGEFYSFIFDKKGSWSFHDHLDASHRGTVIVE